MKKIMVVVGSVRQGRKADAVLKLVQSELAKHPTLRIDLADLKEVKLPFYDHPSSPSMPGFEYKDKATSTWAKRVEDADGFLFLTPEYNHSTTAALKNAIDWVYQGWNHKPVAFVSWGVEGGVRAVEHLRQIVQWPLMRPLRDATYIPIFAAFDRQGNLLDGRLPGSIAGTIKQLEEAL